MLDLLLEMDDLITFVYVKFAERIEAFAEVTLLSREIKLQRIHRDRVNDGLVLRDAACECLLVDFVDRLFDHCCKFALVIISGGLVV